MTSSSTMRGSSTSTTTADGQGRRAGNGKEGLSAWGALEHGLGVAGEVAAQVLCVRPQHLLPQSLVIPAPVQGSGDGDVAPA